MQLPWKWNNIKKNDPLLVRCASGVRGLERFVTERGKESQLGNWGKRDA